MRIEERLGMRIILIELMRMILILDFGHTNDSHSLLGMGMILVYILTVHENGNDCQVESRIILITFFG